MADLKVDIVGVGEIAKEVAGGTRSAMRRLFGPALTEFGEMLTDRVRYWRFRNLVKLDQKVRRIIAEGNVPPEALRALPFGDAFRTIEAASTEEDDDVQELWAGLIFNASRREKPKVNKLYIELLRSIGPADAALLELLIQGPSNSRLRSHRDIEDFNAAWSAKADERWRKFSEEEQGSALQNLTRLRCVMPIPRPLNPGNVLRLIQGTMPIKITGGGALVDPKAFQSLINQINDAILMASGAKDPRITHEVPLHLISPFGANLVGASIAMWEANFVLTPLGNQLMTAVRTVDETQSAKSD